MHRCFWHKRRNTRLPSCHKYHRSVLLLLLLRLQQQQRVPSCYCCSSTSTIPPLRPPHLSSSLHEWLSQAQPFFTCTFCSTRRPQPSGGAWVKTSTGQNRVTEVTAPCHSSVGHVAAMGAMVTSSISEDQHCIGVTGVTAPCHSSVAHVATMGAMVTSSMGKDQHWQKRVTEVTAPCHKPWLR